MATATLIPRVPTRTPKSTPARDKAVLAGDKQAFEQLVHEESPRLYRMIYQIVNNADEARNVLQETFMQSYIRLETFRGDAKLSTWIYAIGLNLARAARRKAARVRVLEHEEFEHLNPQFMSGRHAGNYREWNGEQRLQTEERKRLLYEAIQRLPEQHRTIVNLKDINGWATEDVARLMNISNGAVRVRLHRARQALRALLAPYFSGALTS
ncbi:MAG: sigma-70 family RNA polymerase sigma factor [Bacteroidota bacterium]